VTSVRCHDGSVHIRELNDDMLDPKLLDILACPRCKGPVTPDPQHTRLTCGACRLEYRVDDGIPIMLIDEAVQLREEEGDDA